MRTFEIETPPLQSYSWPVVSEFGQLPPDISAFLALSNRRQQEQLEALRIDSNSHAQFVNRLLGIIYAYRLGYADSPCFYGPNEVLEQNLERAKIRLESELLHFLAVNSTPEIDSQRDLVPLLQQLVADNPGVHHPLFDFLETRARRETLREFLINDVIRNESVDDEVALLVVGHQGLMKEAAAINLYDECGRGKQRHFHTYWLRMLLNSLDLWEELRAYRQAKRPWFSGITSNVFAMLLTRSPYKWAAYGHFLITESWVPPHFERILDGMRRHDMVRDGSDTYFSAHVTLDPTHTTELILGLEHQVPALSSRECSQIYWGCQLAIAGSMQQYDRMLSLLSM